MTEKRLFPVGSDLCRLAPVKILPDVDWLNAVQWSGRIVKELVKLRQFPQVIFPSCRGFAWDDFPGVPLRHISERDLCIAWRGAHGQLGPFHHRGSVILAKRDFLARPASGVQVIINLLPAVPCPHAGWQIFIPCWLTTHAMQSLAPAAASLVLAWILP